MTINITAPRNFSGKILKIQKKLSKKNDPYFVIKLDNEIPNFFLFNDIEDFQSNYNVGSKLEGAAVRNEQLGTFVIEYLKQSSTKKSPNKKTITYKSTNWQLEEEIEKKYLAYIDEEIAMHPDITTQEIDIIKNKMEQKIQKVRHLIKISSIDICLRAMVREELITRYKLISYEDFKKNELSTRL